MHASYLDIIAVLATPGQVLASISDQFPYMSHGGERLAALGSMRALFRVPPETPVHHSTLVLRGAISFSPITPRYASLLDGQYKFYQSVEFIQ